MAEDAFDKYLEEINKAYLRGEATEHPLKDNRIPLQIIEKGLN